MNVSEIIALMANQSVQLDEPSASDLPVYLRYLNLAYFQLLSKLAMKHPDLPKKREVVTCENGLCQSTSLSIFMPKKIYTTGSSVNLLTPKSLDVLLEDDPSLQNTGSPQYWYYDNKVINVYPLFSGQIGIFYIPNPPRLSLNSVSEDIYIPEIYHYLLADGACYYMYQTESGFRNEGNIQRAEKRWENGQNYLASYLVSLSGQTTFSTSLRV